MGDLEKLVILFLVGNIAAFMNVMAGGGSSITLPTLIFLGLESTVANGTNRVAIFLQNIFAILSFHRQKVSAIRQSLTMAVWTIPGAIVGALVAVRISNRLFQTILAFILIGIVISILLPNATVEETVTFPEKSRRWLLYPALFLIGFYGGFIQVGVGFLFIALLYHLLRLNLVYVNMHKVFIVMIYTVPALIVFIASGNVDWKLGLSLASGNALGGWWAARVAVKGGEKVIKGVLSVAILIMSARLLGLF